MILKRFTASLNDIWKLINNLHLDLIQTKSYHMSLEDFEYCAQVILINYFYFFPFWKLYFHWMCILHILLHIFISVRQKKVRHTCLNFMRVNESEFWVNWSSRVVQQMSLLYIDAHRLSELLNINEASSVTLLSRSLLLTEKRRTLKPPFIILSFNTGPARSPQSSIKHYSGAGEHLSRQSSISYCLNTLYWWSGEHV